MDSTIILVKIINATDLDLEFLDEDNGSIDIGNNGYHIFNPTVLLPKSKADEYDPTFASGNKYYCIRDKDNPYGMWTRFMHLTGTADSDGPAMVNHTNNSRDGIVRFDPRQTVDPDRTAGLYLTVSYQEPPSKKKVLWVVGELVTDVLGGGE